MVFPPPLAVLLVGHVASAELMKFVTLKRANLVTSNRAWTNRSNQDCTSACHRYRATWVAEGMPAL